MDANSIAHNVDNNRTKDVLIENDVSFQSMLLSEKCLEGLNKSGFLKPSPIQAKAIPLGRCGFDLIVKSKSGTGKTLVFTLLALEALDLSDPSVQVLVLSPTREIAVQISDSIKVVGSSCEGLQVNSFIGGFPEKDDKDKAQNSHIAVGAPGRIKSLVEKKILDVNSVKIFVLDEADKLMEKSFISDINYIYQALPQKKQIITTSATYRNNLQELLSAYMVCPTYVNSENETQLLLGLKHFIREVEASKNVNETVKRKNKEVHGILSNISFTQCIIFLNYQTRAENVSISLNRLGWNSTFISAAQSQQKRLEAMDKLKNFKCRILLSTDLTARGIDASNIDLVINYDLPLDVSTYLHRMGRAGRYGSRGVCISLVSGEKDLLQIRKFLGQIGGSNLTIAKLSNIEDGVGDLWSENESKFEKISGVVDENEDATLAIKSEVLSLKNSLPVPEPTENCIMMEETQVEMTSTNDVNKNKPFSPEEMKSSDQILNTDSNSAGTVSGDIKLCLQSLAKGNFNFNNIPSPKNTFCEEIHTNERTPTNQSPKENIADITLKSLAEGTFDFSQIQRVDIENKTPTPQDSNSGECSTKNEVYIKNKVMYEVAKILSDPNYSNPDTESNIDDYLKTCINENDNFGDKPLRQNLNNRELQSKVEAMEVCKEGKESTITSKQFHRNNSGNAGKIRKPQELEVENHSKISKNEVFVESKGIYEVERVNQKHNRKISMKSECHGHQNSTAEGKLEGKSYNIFNQAYLHIIEKEKKHWKLFLSSEELQPINQENEMQCNDIDLENEDEYYEEEYCEDEEEDFFFQPDPSVQYDEDGYEYIPNRMVWVPVEETEQISQSDNEKNLEPVENNENTHENIPNHMEWVPEQNSWQASDQVQQMNYVNNTRFEQFLNSGHSNSGCIQRPEGLNQLDNRNSWFHNHFSKCFHQCAVELQNRASTFRTAEEFEQWYSSVWEKRLDDVREYVRKNVYVREMSNYQLLRQQRK